MNKNTILSTDVDKFGKTLKYTKGDVVVWRGDSPAIGRIGCDVDFSSARCYVEECIHFQKMSKLYNSLHYSQLRPSTPKEIEYLGENVLIVLG